jgi:hypothetical protein
MSAFGFRESAGGLVVVDLLLGSKTYAVFSPLDNQALKCSSFATLTTSQ